MELRLYDTLTKEKRPFVPLNADNVGIYACGPTVYGFAHVAEDHVLFSPQAMNDANPVMPRYGALSKRSLDEMIAGARVDVAPYKRDSTDFVLWKPSKPGEPSWPSPSGIKVEGRPGWHIECSAMAWKHLGEKFDIHGGGIDLVFPHHENELAQTCCAFHSDRMANVWMHNGFLQLESEKMSKSLGSFLSMSAEAWKGRKQQASGIDAQQVDRLIADRAAARARKDFKESDRIRDELAAMGVAIKDGKDADGKPVTTWEIA